MRHIAYIGLGANLPSQAGTPEKTILAAVDDLAKAGRVTAVSSLYRTEPVGLSDQPPYVNAVARLETSFQPQLLLDFLLATEGTYGRRRSRDVVGGPRALDLDLLLVDNLVLRTPQLVLPHAELDRRRFVLAPLNEIAPELCHPVSGLSIKELLAALPENGANRSQAVQKMRSQTTEP